MVMQPSLPPSAYVQLATVYPKELLASSSGVLVYYPTLAFADKPALKPYSQLPVVEEDKQNITELFRILATYSPIRLGKKRGYLTNELGPAVGRVYPLRMMEYFITTPVVKQYVLKLRTRSIMFYGRIWPNYIGPIGKDLDNLANRGELAFYAHDFAKAIDKDESRIKALFEKRNWTALYDYVLDRTDER